MTFHEVLVNMPLDEMFDLCDEHNQLLLSNVCPSNLPLNMYLKYSDWEHLGCRVIIRKTCNGEPDSRWSHIITRSN